MESCVSRAEGGAKMLRPITKRTPWRGDASFSKFFLKIFEPDTGLPQVQSRRCAQNPVRANEKTAGQTRAAKEPEMKKRRGAAHGARCYTGGARSLLSLILSVVYGVDAM